MKTVHLHPIQSMCVCVCVYKSIYTEIQPLKPVFLYALSHADERDDELVLKKW